MSFFTVLHLEILKMRQIKVCCRAHTVLWPRWDKSYEACQLDELIHTPLTKPCKAFEYFFEGERKGRGRDNIVKLEVIAEGQMNAVAFWFDLHLDEQESICSGEAPDTLYASRVKLPSVDLHIAHAS